MNNSLSSGRHNYIVISENDQITEKKSPFVVYKKMSYKKVKKRDCSSAEIQRMLSNGTISSVHDRILKALGRYGYLNSFMLRTYLSHITGGQIDYDGVQMRKTLKNMVNMGFLIQYELFHYNSEGILQGSPFIYCISNGGKKYLKKQGIISFNPLLKKPFEPVDILYLLAFNQFHIMFLNQYGKSSILMAEDYYGNCYENLGVSNIYTLRLPEDGVLNLFVQTVRNDPDWAHGFLSALRKIKWNTEVNKIECFAVLFLCETEYQAMECARKQNCDADIKDMDVFYETDASVITEKDVFNRLISVQPKNDYSCRNIIKLDIRC